MSATASLPPLDWSDYSTDWFTPATAFQYQKATDQGMGIFTYCDPRNWFNGVGSNIPTNVKLPNILVAIIILGLILVVIVGTIFSCWVGDIVFPFTNPLIFTGETLVMSLGMASLCSVLFYFTRKSDATKAKQPFFSSESLLELGILTAKFGLLHLVFQFTGFYSWVYPDAALGGALTTSYGKPNCPLGGCHGLDNLAKDSPSGAPFVVPH